MKIRLCWLTLYFWLSMWLLTQKSLQYVLSCYYCVVHSSISISTRHIYSYIYISTYKYTSIFKLIPHRCFFFFISSSYEIRLLSFVSFFYFYLLLKREFSVPVNLKFVENLIQPIIFHQTPRFTTSLGAIRLFGLSFVHTLFNIIDPYKRAFNSYFYIYSWGFDFI